MLIFSNAVRFTDRAQPVPVSNKVSFNTAPYQSYDSALKSFKPSPVISAFRNPWEYSI